MRIKIISLLFLVGILAFVGNLKISSITKQKRIAELDATEKRGTLSWYAKRARIEGKERLVLPGPLAEYATVHSVDEAMAHLGAVIAQPIKKKSLIHTDFEIVTWYKFEILENLTKKKLPQCSARDSFEEPLPQELLPLNPNEILMLKYGGNVEIEGVEITMVDTQIPEFSMSQEYVMFLSTDRSGRVAGGIGPPGIFIVNDDTVKAITNEPHPFIQDVEARYNRSLQLLRADMNRRAGRTTVTRENFAVLENITWPFNRNPAVKIIANFFISRLEKIHASQVAGVESLARLPWYSLTCETSRLRSPRERVLPVRQDTGTN